MSAVVLDVSMSLDGYSTGPDVGPAEPMGVGGEDLHAWMGVDRDGQGAVAASVGAALVGRRTFDLGLTPWGGTPWAGVPTFVITHRTRDDLLGDNGGLFAFDTLESSVRRAKDAAGGKD